MASSSEWYQFAPDGVLKILRPRGCRGSDWPPRQIADLRRRPGVSRARSTARLWLNFGCSRLARLMSLRAAATERDVPCADHHADERVLLLHRIVLGGPCPASALQ